MARLPTVISSRSAERRTRKSCSRKKDLELLEESLRDHVVDEQDLARRLRIDDVVRAPDLTPIFLRSSGAIGISSVIAGLAQPVDRGAVVNLRPPREQLEPVSGCRSRRESTFVGSPSSSDLDLRDLLPSRTIDLGLVEEREQLFRAYPERPEENGGVDLALADRCGRTDQVASGRTRSRPTSRGTG